MAAPETRQSPPPFVQRLRSSVAVVVPARELAVLGEHLAHVVTSSPTSAAPTSAAFPSLSAFPGSPTYAAALAQTTYIIFRA